jgi:surface protein
MYLAFGSPVRVLLLTVFFVLFFVLLLLVSAFRASAFNGEVSSWDVSSVITMFESKWKVALPS